MWGPVGSQVSARRGPGQEGPESDVRAALRASVLQVGAQSSALRPWGRMEDPLASWLSPPPHCGLQVSVLF